MVSGVPGAALYNGAGRKVSMSNVTALIELPPLRLKKHMHRTLCVCHALLVWLVANEVGVKQLGPVLGQPLVALSAVHRTAQDKKPGDLQVVKKYGPRMAHVGRSWPSACLPQAELSTRRRNDNSRLYTSHGSASSGGRFHFVFCFLL